MGGGTRAIFENLLKNSRDTDNPNMRDIFFPFAGTVCDNDDVESFDFKVQADGQCWENVHPDHLQVYGRYCFHCILHLLH